MSACSQGQTISAGGVCAAQADCIAAKCQARAVRCALVCFNCRHCLALLGPAYCSAASTCSHIAFRRHPYSFTLFWPDDPAYCPPHRATPFPPAWQVWPAIEAALDELVVDAKPGEVPEVWVSGHR